jgi:antitoxin component YwqK of YwqJK toxin-antitoxin module
LRHNSRVRQDYEQVPQDREAVDGVLRVLRKLPDLVKTLTEQASKLLRLKGVPEVEEEPEVDSTKILKQYREKKLNQQNSDKWDDLDVDWNSDGTLNRLVAYKNGEVLYELDFAWNPDGSISKIMRR